MANYIIIWAIFASCMAFITEVIYICKGFQRNKIKVDFIRHFGTWILLPIWFTIGLCIAFIVWILGKESMTRFWKFCFDALMAEPDADYSFPKEKKPPITVVQPVITKIIKQKYQELKDLEVRIFQMKVLKNNMQHILAQQPLDVEVKITLLGNSVQEPFWKERFPVAKNFPDDAQYVINAIQNRIDELQKQFDDA